MIASFFGYARSRGTRSCVRTNADNGLADKAPFTKRVEVELGDAQLHAKVCRNLFGGEVAGRVEEELECLKCFWVELVGVPLKLLQLRVAICYKLLKLRYALRQTGALDAKSLILVKRFVKLEVQCRKLLLREEDSLFFDGSRGQVSNYASKAIEHSELSQAANNSDGKHFSRFASTFIGDKSVGKFGAGDFIGLFYPQRAK